MTDLERAREVFADNPYALELTGCTLEDVGPGFARCALKIEPKHLNSLGKVMGGAIYTLADMAYAVASNFDRDVFVTSAGTLYFLKAAEGGTLTATARELRAGRRTCTFAIEVRDDANDLVAHGSFSGALVQERKKST